MSRGRARSAGSGWERPTPQMRLLGTFVAVGAGLHIRSMIEGPSGLVDILWICNSMTLGFCCLSLIRLHRGVNFAVFFWTAIGLPSWALYVLAHPDQFRFTSLTAHVLVPLCSGLIVCRARIPANAWVWTALTGQLSLFAFLWFHPERDLLFLFDFSASPPLVQAGAILGLHLYYGAWLAAATWLARRLGLSAGR